MAPRLTLRSLTVAAALVLVAGTASASVRLAGDEAPGSQAVLAAGGTVDAVEVTASAPPVAPPVAPPSTTNLSPATTTSTRVAPVTTRPAPALPAPPATPTPTSAVPPAPSTTTTTARPRPTASVTIVNNFSHHVVITLNGQRFEVSVGRQAGPQDLVLAADGNDVIELTVVDRPLCGLGDAGGLFQAGGKYRVEVYALTASCDPMDVLPGPGLRITKI